MGREKQPVGRERQTEQSGQLPQSAFVYAPPQATPRETDHRTLELKRVRLAPEIDPRRQATQMLRRGPASSLPGALQAVGLDERFGKSVWLYIGLGVLVGAGTWGAVGGTRLGARGVVALAGEVRPALPQLPLRVAGAPAVSFTQQGIAGMAETPAGVGETPAGVVAPPSAAVASAVVTLPASHSTGAGGLRAGINSRISSGFVSNRPSVAKTAQPAPTSRASDSGNRRVWVTPSEPEVWLK